MSMQYGINPAIYTTAGIRKGAVSPKFAGTQDIARHLNTMIQNIGILDSFSERLGSRHAQEQRKAAISRATDAAQEIVHDSSFSLDNILQIVSAITRNPTPTLRRYAEEASNQTASEDRRLKAQGVLLTIASLIHQAYCIEYGVNLAESFNHSMDFVAQLQRALASANT